MCVISIIKRATIVAAADSITHDDQKHRYLHEETIEKATTATIIDTLDFIVNYSSILFATKPTMHPTALTHPQTD